MPASSRPTTPMTSTASAITKLLFDDFRQTYDVTGGFPDAEHVTETDCPCLTSLLTGTPCICGPSENTVLFESLKQMFSYVLQCESATEDRRVCGNY